MTLLKNWELEWSSHSYGNAKEAKMKGYYINRNGIVDSEGNVCQSDYLAWLLKEDTIKDDGVLPDLDYAMSCLLHLIGATKEQGQTLLKTNKLLVVDDARHPFTISYYSGKVFSIDFGNYKNHCWRTFYNMGQYRDVHYSDDESMEYAIGEAREALQVGELVINAYRDIGITSKSLTSPIKAFIKSNLYPPVPTVDDIPEEAGELAYQCIHGNWVEGYQLGHFDNVFDFDISGAYGYETSRLYDLRRGLWAHCPTEPTGAVYGFAKGILDVKAPFSPFIMKHGGSQYTPTGAREACITKGEWDFLKEYGLGTLDSQDAWWWIPRDMQQYQPLLGVINRLWQLRLTATSMANKVLKRIIVAIWGLTGQTTGHGDDMELGEYNNPVYHSVVESNCRLKVARVVLDNGLYPDHLVNIAVDGIVSTKAIPVNGDKSLGSWRLTHQGKGLSVSSGIMGIEGKGGDEDFAITYDKLMGLISDDPEATEYALLKLSPVTVAKAINGDRWDDLGKLEITDRAIPVQGDKKRLYSRAPEIGKDLLDNVYQSLPMDISFLRE